MQVPNDRKYTDHDEWVKLDGDVLTLGITDFAQDALGELVHIEMPEVGDEVEPGGVACEVESVKAVAEVYSPLGGEVIEVNESLDGAEDTVNESPYGDGWLVKIRISGGDLQACLDAEAYENKISQG